MSSRWKRVPLGQLVQKDRSVSYGVVQPGQPMLQGIPIVRVSDIRSGRIETRDPLRISRDIEAKHERTRLRGGELLLTLVGTVGETAIVPPALAGWNTARAVGVIPVDPEIGPRWIRYVIGSAGLQARIGARLNTTVQATLNLRDVAELPVPIPERAERERITRILGALDDKIELNRRTNETLEAMARALFQSWFVDFDPVRAKMEGRQPEGMDAETAKLFPSSLAEHQGGLTPNGWTRSSVYAAAEVTYGAPYSSSRFNSEGNGLPLIRIRDLQHHRPEIFTDEQHARETIVDAGDVVVGMDGEFRVHQWKGPRARMNQRVCAFWPRRPFARTFVALSIEPLLMQLERGKVGTTVIHLGKSDIDRFQLLLPSAPVASLFAAQADAFLSTQLQLAAQSRTLAALRDALLPKLLSGELRVPDAERAVSAAL